MKNNSAATPHSCHSYCSRSYCEETSSTTIKGSTRGAASPEKGTTAGDDDVSPSRGWPYLLSCCGSSRRPGFSAATSIVCQHATNDAIVENFLSIDHPRQGIIVPHKSQIHYWLIVRKMMMTWTDYLPRSWRPLGHLRESNMPMCTLGKRVDPNFPASWDIDMPLLVCRAEQ